MKGDEVLLERYRASSKTTARDEATVRWADAPTLRMAT